MKAGHMEGLLAGIIGTTLCFAASLAIAQRGTPTPVPELPPIPTAPVPSTPAVSATQSSVALRLACQNDGSIRVEVVPKP